MLKRTGIGLGRAVWVLAFAVVLLAGMASFVASRAVAATTGDTTSASLASGAATATQVPALAPGPYLKRPDLARAVWATEYVDVVGSLAGTHAGGPRVARLELWHAEDRNWVLQRSVYVDGVATPDGLRYRVRLKPLSAGRWRAIVIHPQDLLAARSTSGWTYLRSLRAKIIALTLDDGPSPGNTDDVLAVLRRLQVKGTFFLSGQMVGSHPAVAKRVVAQGHAIGNHSQTHAMLGRRSASKVAWEISTATAVIRRVTGVMPRWFRPPGGSTSATVRAQCRRLGIRHILWDIDPQDWRGRGAAYTMSYVLSHARPGKVVLLHDGPARRIGTARAVERIVPALKARGYDFVTLDELGALLHFLR